MVFRHDRILSKTHKKEGGGVLMACKASLIASEVELWRDHDEYLEMLAIKIKLRDYDLFIFCAYIPHWARSISRFEAFNKTMSILSSKIKDEDVFIVLGDFNLTKADANN